MLFKNADELFYYELLRNIVDGNCKLLGEPSVTAMVCTDTSTGLSLYHARR